MTIGSGSNPYPYLGWLARILPYLDQPQLWQLTEEAFALDPNFLDNPPHVASCQPLKVFACPSDGRVASPNYSGTALTSYVGVQGLDYVRQGGVLTQDWTVSINTIIDGTSSTLMVGERPPSADELFGFWYAGWGQSMNGSAETILGVTEMMVYPDYRTICRSGPYSFGPGSLTNVCDAFHFWSLHADGANFIFADGSVRWLPYAAKAMLPALATIAGGEVVSLPY